MSRKKPIPIFELTLGALYIALFALAGNVPVLSAITIAGIPVTLQNFLIAMMGLTLGVRGGLLSYGALLLLTACGLPMMSGRKGRRCGASRAYLRLYLRLGVYHPASRAVCRSRYALPAVP